MYADGYLNMQVQVTNKGNNIARGIDLYLTSSKKKVSVPQRAQVPSDPARLDGDQDLQGDRQEERPRMGDDSG